MNLKTAIILAVGLVIGAISASNALALVISVDMSQPNSSFGISKKTRWNMASSLSLFIMCGVGGMRFIGLVGGSAGYWSFCVILA